MLSDRNKAFEVFRKSYRKNEVFEEQKASLKDKYDEAKVVHDTVNLARKNMGAMSLRAFSHFLRLLMLHFLSRRLAQITDRGIAS